MENTIIFQHNHCLCQCTTCSDHEFFCLYPSTIQTRTRVAYLSSSSVKNLSHGQAALLKPELKKCAIHHILIWHQVTTIFFQI